MMAPLSSLVAAQRRQHAERDAHGKGEQGRRGDQLERRRHAFDDQVGDRPGQAIALAEIAGGGVAEEAGELDRHRILQPELAAHLGALGRRRLLAHHVVHRVAHEVEQREAQERHRQHDGEGLQQTRDDESQHSLHARTSILRSAPQACVSKDERDRAHFIVEYLKLGKSLAKIGIVTLSLIDQTMS